MSYKRMPIKAKLMVGFGVVLGLALVAGIFSVHAYLTTVKNYSFYIKGRMNQLNALWEMDSRCKSHIHFFKDIIIRGSNPADLIDLVNHCNELQGQILRDISTFKNGPYRLTSEEDQKDLSIFESAYKSFMNREAQAQKIISQTGDRKAADELTRGMSYALVVSLRPIIERSKKMTLLESERLWKQSQNRVMWILGGFLLSFFLGLAFAHLFARSISQPIKTLSAVTEQIANGDFTADVIILNEDEVGLLAERFRVMMKNLNEVLYKVKEATGQITSAGSEILAASQQQATAARQQSSAISETTSAAKELSVSSEQIGDSIKRVSRAAGQALAGIATIKESINKTGLLIHSLGEKSQQIGKITELINDIADQTNLLAVNASIEATRAGEQGRGFSVVAEAIRKLADSTANSTKDISALIEIIQHEMTNAVFSMETSINQIDEGAQLSKQTVETAKEIAMNSTQQVSGSKQIAEAMASIDEAMKQIAQGSQESQQAAKFLAGLANELLVMTGRFKTVA